jgi:hypothetical protein
MAVVPVDLLSVPSAGAASSCCRQIGALSTDSVGGEYNQSEATTVSSPLRPSTEYDNPTVFNWIGSFLSDNSFVQAGYAFNQTDCPNDFELFFEWFTPSGATTYTRSHCHITPQAMTFSINNRGSNGQNAWNGEASTGGIIGSTYVDNAASSTGANEPYAVSELSVASGLPNAYDEIPGMEYHSAEMWSTCGCGGPYSAINSANIYGFNRVCSSSNGTNEEVFNDRIFNEFRAGTDYSSGCIADGTQLWN